MKPSRLLALLATTLICAATTFSWPNQSAEGFSVKEYEDFHHVLHELQHDALPKKDYARIRAKAEELVNLGNAIVQLGVPDGTETAHVEDFQKELKKFAATLTKFSEDAKSGSDDELTVSYSAVHESFEKLADWLPRKA